MSELKEITHARMVTFFPEALETALASYRRVLDKKEDKYPEFKKQQEVCKVAVAHIQLLLKLGRDLSDDAKGAGGAEMEHENLHELIKNAQDEIGGM